MKKQFTVIETDNSKYYKDVPYISKREFKNIDNAIVQGQTRLKMYDSDSEDNALDILIYDNEQYEIKDKIFGFKKGYVYTGNNNYILLKWRIPFLFLFLLLLLLLLFLFYINSGKEIEEPIVEPLVQTEIVIPEEKEEQKEEEVIPPKNDAPKKETKPIAPISKDYQIMFDANGGYGDMKSITCELGKECVLIENTFSKEGYDFLGWSTTKDGELLYNDKSNVEDLASNAGETKTLFAKWEIQSFKIVFIDYDETIIEEYNLDYGSNIVVPEDPTRKGYNFLGWDKELDIVKAENEYKALYEINTYDISYQLNGGILKDAPQKYNVEINDLEINEPTKVGYSFTGWNINDSKELIKKYIISKGTVNNLELIANYDANSYNLIFNSGKENDGLIIREVKFDSNYGELPVISKDGYTFKGWKNQEENFVSEDTIYDIPDDINLYADWEINTYDIIYQLNGGTLEDAPKNYNVEDKDISIPSPSKKGYIFTGWTTLDNKTPIKDYVIPKGTTGDKELVANYEPITYYVLYDSNSAEGDMQKEEIKYNQTFKLSKNKFTKEGHKFVGWSTTKDGNVVYQDEAEICNLSQNNGETIKLYAKWDILQFNVRYYDLFGSLLKESKVNYGSKSSPPEDPFMEGYTFVKWNPDNGVIIGDTDYHAEYSVNEYTIRYNLNMGRDDDLKIIDYNVESNAIQIPNPVRKGYTFIGWTGTNGLKPQKDLIIPKGSTGNKSYKANWTSNEYIVSLNPNGGLLDVKSVIISYNSFYGTLPEPTREGYTFEGWYYNDVLIQDDILQRQDKDHELIAKWKTINYDISYELNGGTLEDAPKNYNIESENITIPSPSKKGYNFIGWTTSDNNNPIINYVINKGSIGDKKLIANYELITYYVSYDSNGDSGSMNNDAVKYNQTFKLSKNQFTKPGYTFVGWSTTKDGNVVYQDEASINNLSFTEGEIIKLYAKWQIVNYNISYELNGGTLDSMPQNYNVESNNITIPTPSKKGYNFIGWTTSDNNNPVINYVINKGSIGDKKLIANYELITYYVSYDSNGGSGSMNNDAVKYNQTFKLSKNQFTKPGYTFVGWSTTKDGNVVYQDETSINNLSFTGGEIIRLYAKWQIVYYDVVYNLSGGSSEPLQTSYSIESDTFTLPQPTRRGYTFIGWTGSNGTTPTMNVSVSKGSTGNKNYTANYSLNVYTITYSTSMSSLPNNPTTYTVESETFTLSNPSKYGEFSFVGWTGTDASEKQITLTIPKGSIGDREYIANWYDDTPPTITGFEVKNLGVNDNGHDIYIFVEGYDNGVGIDRYETWLVPYKNGSGAGRELGGERVITNVLYLKDPEGRTLCGYAIDKNGNEAERCYTVYG